MSEVLSAADRSSFTTIPLGCRLIAFICILGYVFNNSFVECSPDGVISHWQIWTLVTASFIHTHWLSLIIGLFLSWKRFVRMEHDLGTFGFLAWVVQVSVIIHSVYVVAVILFLYKMDHNLMTQPIHGLWPLLCASFTFDAKRDPFGEIALWPFPWVVQTRVLPLLALGGAWIVHCEAHLDAIVAMILAFAINEEPLFAVSDQLMNFFATEEHPSLDIIRNMDAFTERNAGFKQLPVSGSFNFGHNEFDFRNDVDSTVSSTPNAHPVFSEEYSVRKFSPRGSVENNSVSNNNYIEENHIPAAPVRGEETSNNYSIGASTMSASLAFESTSNLINTTSGIANQILNNASSVLQNSTNKLLVNTDENIASTTASPDSFTLSYNNKNDFDLDNDLDFLDTSTTNYNNTQYSNNNNINSYNINSGLQQNPYDDFDDILDTGVVPKFVNTGLDNDDLDANPF